MSSKHTLFIIKSDGRAKGVKTYPTLRQVVAYAAAEYEDYMQAGRAYVVETTTKIVWKAPKE
jgi:hypothetical protein